MTQPNRAPLILSVIGCVLLLYALLGNYIALPGYLRFLERGGTSAAGNAFDLAVVIGAVKTIVWMFSFQLGVLCLALAYSMRQRLHTMHFAIAGIVWLMLWSWPSLPRPGAWFYVTFGVALLFVIGWALLNARPSTTSRTSQSAFLGALAFFAFATWEVCGLGSTGRMLHPQEAANPIAHNILVTQSSKLMIEFVIAWSLLAVSLRQRLSAT